MGCGSGGMGPVSKSSSRTTAVSEAPELAPGAVADEVEQLEVGECGGKADGDGPMSMFDRRLSTHLERELGRRQGAHEVEALEDELGDMANRVALVQSVGAVEGCHFRWLNASWAALRARIVSASLVALPSVATASDMTRWW